MDPATVYEFEVFDPRRRAWVRSSRLGTVEAIHAVGGVPLRSTAMVVDRALVDAEGFLIAPPERSASHG